MLMKELIYLYVLIAGMTFVWLGMNGELIVERKDGEEIEEKDIKVIKIIQFIILSLMAIMWFISVPIIKKMER